MGLPPQFRNRYPRRPPLFDGLLNNVRAITKKVEHIKGFKFEFAGALSNNFHLTNSWLLPAIVNLFDEYFRVNQNKLQIP